MAWGNMAIGTASLQSRSYLSPACTAVIMEYGNTGHRKKKKPGYRQRKKAAPNAQTP